MALAVSPHDLDDSEDFSLTKQQMTRRFGSPVREEQIYKLIDQGIPDNTKKTTSWCMSVWKAWSKHRGVTTSIETLSAQDLNN